MWIYNGKELTDDAVDGHIGFVYRITCTKTDKKYIGKKLFQFSKTKQVKGKKKKFKVESDWRTYYGSNDQLNEDVAALGVENFKREVLRLCKSKGECSYYEAKYQFELDALIREDYYNTWISVRVRKSHLKNLN